MGLPAFFGLTTFSSTGYMEARTLIHVGREVTLCQIHVKGIQHDL